jgi:hypothetical protein
VLGLKLANTLAVDDLLFDEFEVPAGVEPPALRRHVSTDATEPGWASRAVIPTLPAVTAEASSEGGENDDEEDNEDEEDDEPLMPLFRAWTVAAAAAETLDAGSTLAMLRLVGFEEAPM